MAFTGFQRWAEDTTDKFATQVGMVVAADLPTGEVLGSLVVNNPDFKTAMAAQETKAGIGKYSHQVCAVTNQQLRMYEIKGGGITGRKNPAIVGAEIIPFHLVTAVDKKVEPKSMMNPNPLGRLRIRLSDGRSIDLRSLAAPAQRFGSMLQSALADANAVNRPAPTNSATVGAADELLKWKQLLDAGAITPAEFEHKKREILS